MAIATELAAQAKGTFDDPNQSQNGKDEGSPVDEWGTIEGLVGKDGKEGPGDGNAGGEVAFGGRKGIGGGSGLEEEEGEEDEDLCPETGLVVGGVDAESFKSRDDDENSGPAMVEGEWEMDEELVCEALRGVVFFHNIVDVGYGGADEEGKDESENEMMASPQVYVNSIEDTEQGETPGNVVNDDSLSKREELEDDGAQEQEVNEGPKEECPRSRGDVCLFAAVVNL